MVCKEMKMIIMSNRKSKYIPTTLKVVKITGVFGKVYDNNGNFISNTSMVLTFDFKHLSLYLNIKRYILV